jgi:outer membrane receptor for monomeric catechols
MGNRMSAAMLRTLTMVVVAVCCCCGGVSAAGARSRHAPAVMRAHAESAASHKTDRLSSPRPAQPVLDTPGQTTVLTRQVLDDMNATTLRDALRSTAGVTVGR